MKKTDIVHYQTNTLCAALELILGKLAAVEATQRQHSQFLQQLLSGQNIKPDETELPDDLQLPLDTVDDLMELHNKLHDHDTAALMVCLFLCTTLGTHNSLCSFRLCCFQLSTDPISSVLLYAL